MGAGSEAGTYNHATICCFVLLFTSICFNAQAAKKATVRELKDTFSSFLQAKKTDQEMATRLKEMELSEQLTLSTKTACLPSRQDR